MSNYLLKLGILLFFVIVSSIGYFLTISSIENKAENENGKREFVLKNAEIFGSDKDGSFTYKIFTKKAKTNDLKQTIFLEQLLIRYISEPTIEWYIHSDSGQIISKTNVLALSGNVVIENKSKDNPSTIVTNYLEINPNTLTIATNRDVLITINDNKIQAKGFNAQLRENKLNFSSNMTSKIASP